MRLLIGTDSEYSALVRIANEMQHADDRSPLLVLVGSIDSFSFKPRPSTILVPGMPAGVIAALPVLEEFGIASRLASEIGLPGCYDGLVFDLAQEWLRNIEPSLRTQASVTFVAGSADLTTAAEEFGRRVGLAVRVIPA